MGDQEDANNNWVRSLVTGLELRREKEIVIDTDHFRTQLEESQLLDRVRKVVGEVNGEVGYHLLDLLEFLRPHRSVLRVSFVKNGTEYNMEIVVRTSGPVVVFHSVKKVTNGWERYLHGCSLNAESRIAFSQNFNPADVTEDVVHTWFAYVLSGFGKKLKPVGSADRNSMAKAAGLSGFA